MTGKTKVWPVNSTISKDIVRWPAVISSPASSVSGKQEHNFVVHDFVVSQLESRQMRMALVVFMSELFDGSNLKP